MERMHAAKECKASSVLSKFKEMEKRVANGEDLDEDAREYFLFQIGILFYWLAARKYFFFVKIGTLFYWLADTEDLKVDTLDLHQVAE